MALLVVMLAFTASVAPLASASHRTLYEQGIDRSAGQPLEDDGARFNAPNSMFDQKENRVTAPGTFLGEGGLMLDSRMVNTVGTGGEGVDLATNAWSDALFGRPDVLLPGTRHVSSWYGWWLDLNGDFVIDDLHDATCGTSPCADDEFVWRGLGSGDPVTIFHFGNPNNGPLVLYVSAWSTYGNDTSSEIGFKMTDRTARTNPEQGWVGIGRVSTDAGFLDTVETMTIADPPPAKGSRYGFDVLDENALVDVDRYEAVSPDIELLWHGTFQAARAVYDANNPFPVDRHLGIVGDVSRMIDEPRRDANERANAAIAAALQVTSQIALAPWDAKEPNHVSDDYEGRALFGGIGDRVGSYNAYPGYVDSFHLYVDNLARAAVCQGAYAEVPGTGVSATVNHVNGCFTRAEDPIAANAGTGRSAGTLLTFYAHVMLWRDGNGDTHVGDLCDPGTEEFDAERNTCDPDATPAYPSTWPHKGGESIKICSSTTARDGVITVRPVGGEWPDVVVLRDYSFLTRNVYSPALETPSGTETVTLRWHENCGSNDLWTTSRDAIVFGGGTDVPLLVETTIRLPDGYKDLTRGIDIAAEYVTDVDVLPAVL